MSITAGVPWLRNYFQQFQELLRRAERKETVDGLE